MLTAQDIFEGECYLLGDGGPRRGVCPIDNSSPVSCAGFLDLPAWLDVSPKLFFPAFGIGTDQLRAIQRGAVSPQTGSMAPVLVAPLLAIMARFSAPFGLRSGTRLYPCGPAELLTRLQQVLKSQRNLTAVPFMRMLGQNARADFAELSPRDRDAFEAEANPEPCRRPDATLAVACGWINHGPLTSTWPYWMKIARREASLRGIEDLNGPAGWRQVGVVTAPRSRGDAVWHNARAG